MNKVGVIGAGLMGNGIAHVAAAAGYDVILSDVSIERAEAGKANIEKNLGRQLAKGGISEADFKATLDRVRLTTDKIGRASCRESVCQYVEIAGLAGALKKKQ